MTASVPKDEVWYRYNHHTTSNATFNLDGDCESLDSLFVHVELDEYKVLRHTPTGVWIRTKRYERNSEKFICRAWRKRWACPTIEEARISFIARKKIQLSIYQHRIEALHAAIAIAEGTAHRWKGRITKPKAELTS